MLISRVFRRCSAAILATAILPWGMSIAQESSVSDQITALTTAYQEKLDGYYKDYRAASTDEERKKISENSPDASEVVEPMMALVADDPKSKDAATAAKWVLRNSRTSPPESVVNILKAQALESGFDDLALGCLYVTSDDITAVLKQAVKENPDHKSKAAAAYALSSAMSRRGGDPDKDAVLQRRQFLDIAVEHGGEVMLGKKSIATRAEATIFELENLQIGMTAPDIKGEDIDGVEFALSDYRGKVVVIDFWGDW